MSSLFDYLQPEEDPGGLTGMALQLQRQGGQPQGLKQGLGAGLLGLSGFAEEALPQAIQGGFGPGLLAGFLGGLGGPARKAQAQEEERGKESRAVQLAFLRDAFPKLSPQGKTEILRRLGVDVELGEEKGEPSLAFKEIVEAYGSILGDENQDPKTRSEAFEGLRSLAPEVEGALEGISFFGTQKTGSDHAAQIYANNTTESANRFFDVNDKEHYGRYDQLVPKPDKADDKEKTTKEQLDLQAVQDYGLIQQLAQREGVGEEEAVDLYFSDKAQARRSNFERTYGMTGGASPPSELELLLRTGEIISRSGIAARMRTPQQLFPATRQYLGMAEEEAERRATEKGTIALPGEKAGARNPAGRAAPPHLLPAQGQSPELPGAFPGPVAPPQGATPAAAPGGGPALTPQTTQVPPALRQSVKPEQVGEVEAIYRAMAAAGIDVSQIKDFATLKAKLTSLPIKENNTIVNLARQLQQESTQGD